MYYHSGRDFSTGDAGKTDRVIEPWNVADWWELRWFPEWHPDCENWQLVNANGLTAGTAGYVNFYARRTERNFTLGARTDLGTQLSARLDPTYEGGDNPPNTVAIVTGWQGHLLSDTTMPGSSNCGLVRYLVYALLHDPLVIEGGGFLRTIHRPQSSFYRFPHHMNQARENCDVVIGVNFRHKASFAHERGESYLRGAHCADYRMAFFYKARRNANSAQMVVDNLLVKISEFGATDESARAFAEKYGYHWFFCYCKRNPDDELDEPYHHCWDMN